MTALVDNWTRNSSKFLKIPCKQNFDQRNRWNYSNQASALFTLSFLFSFLPLRIEPFPRRTICSNDPISQIQSSILIPEWEFHGKPRHVCENLRFALLLRHCCNERTPRVHSNALPTRSTSLVESTICIVTIYVIFILFWCLVGESANVHQSF